MEKEKEEKDKTSASRDDKKKNHYSLCMVEDNEGYCCTTILCNEESIARGTCVAHRNAMIAK